MERLKGLSIYPQNVNVNEVTLMYLRAKYSSVDAIHRLLRYTFQLA